MQIWSGVIAFASAQRRISEAKCNSFSTNVIEKVIPENLDRNRATQGLSHLALILMNT